MYVYARVRTCTRLQACVLIATVREPLSDAPLIGHLTSTEEAARKLAKRATGFNLIPNSFLSCCCPLNNSLSRGNGTKIKKSGIQNRVQNGDVIALRRIALSRCLTRVWRNNGDHNRFSINTNSKLRCCEALGPRALKFVSRPVCVCVCVPFPCC